MACLWFWSGNSLLSHFHIHCYWTRLLINRPFRHKDNALKFPWTFEFTLNFTISSKFVHAFPWAAQSKVTLTQPLLRPQFSLAFETVTIFTALTSFTITRTNYHPILLVFRPLVINTSCSSTPCCLSFLYHLHLLCPLSSLLHSVLPAGLGCSLWCQHTERGRKQEWNGEKQADELVALHGEVYLRIAVVMVKHKCVTDHQ